MNTKSLLIFILFLVSTSVFAQKVDPYKPDSKKPKEIKGMKLVWADEFNNTGKPDTTVWKNEKGFVRNNEIQWYQAANATCAKGVLLIEGRKENFNNPNYDSTSTNWKTNRKKVLYSSASLNTRGNKQWLYGRFEVRARVDTAKGAWPAIWTLGTVGGWPANGEVDQMEFYRVKDVPTILANVAWGGTQRGSAKWDSKRIPLTDFTSKDPDWVKKFHIWRMDWSKDSINLYLDDVLYNACPLSQTINGDGTNPFKNPEYILLNLALGSNGGDPEKTVFPIKFEVDYVRVYQDIDADKPSGNSSEAK